MMCVVSREGNDPGRLGQPINNGPTVRRFQLPQPYGATSHLSGVGWGVLRELTGNTGRGVRDAARKAQATAASD